MLSVIGCLQIDGWDVAAVFVEAAVVERSTHGPDRACSTPSAPSRSSLSMRLASPESARVGVGDERDIAELDRVDAHGLARCRIPVFVELARRIVNHRDTIDAALDHGLSQGLIESTDAKIRLLTRIAFGFRSAEALIALAMLALGGHRPALLGRA